MPLSENLHKGELSWAKLTFAGVAKIHGRVDAAAAPLGRSTDGKK
jgi:hypothetical protein